MQIMQIGKDILPYYPTVITVALIILPTLLALLLRYILNNYLRKLTEKINKCLLKINTERLPPIIDKLEQRILAKNNYHHINTSILIYNTYNQEHLRFFCLKVRCESIDNYCQIVPNLMLVFGLIGTFLGIIINLNNFARAIEVIEVDNLSKLIVELNKLFQGTGLSFIVSIIAIVCSCLLTIFNLTWNTNLSKAELFGSLEDYIYNNYIPKLQTNYSTEESLENLTKNFEDFLIKYVDIIEQTLEKALEKIDKTYEKIERTSAISSQTAALIEKNQFPEKIASATNNLAIAQHQIFQSFTQLQNFTQSLELKIDSLQQVVREVIELKKEINQLKQKSSTNSEIINKDEE